MKGQEEKRHIRDFWKNLLFNNLGIKISSVLCAIVFWLFITNVADPYKTKNFDIPVQVIHEDAISSVHQVYEIVDGKTARVSVYGRRSVVDKLSSSDVSAVADLSDLSKVNAVPVEASVAGKYSSDITVECSQVLKISLEDMDAKQIKVSVTCEGTPAGDYSVGDCVARPNVIEVIGGESVISRVASVEVVVNVNGASESFRKNVEPVAYDSKKRKITSETLSFNVQSVRANIQLLKKKEVPVNVEVKGTPAKGYEYVDLSSSPETIEVAGKQKDLDAISEITVPVDITGLKSDSENLEQNIDLTKYISSRLKIPNEDEKNVSVKVSIQRLPSKVISLPVSQISLKNVRRGYTAEIDSGTNHVALEVRGTKGALIGLTAESFTGVIDCGGYGEGKYSLPVEVNLGEDYILDHSVKAQVVIKRRI